MMVDDPTSVARNASPPSAPPSAPPSNSRELVSSSAFSLSLPIDRSSTFHSIDMFALLHSRSSYNDQE